VLVAREGELRDVLARGAEARLRAIPGVVHVSVGLRERGGAITDDHAIRVYVREKQPLDEVAPAERIPAEIDGVPTDVNVVGEFRFAADNARYRPLVGGIQITNRIIDVNDTMTRTQLHRGTLGCFATRISDGSQVLVSNWHVLAANGGRNGDRVYKPAPTSIPPVDLADVPLRPQDGDDAIGKIVQTVVNNSVDFGSVDGPSIRPRCQCLCGIPCTDAFLEVTRADTWGHARTRFVPTCSHPCSHPCAAGDAAWTPPSCLPARFTESGRLRKYPVLMAAARRTVRVELDERLVSRARAEARDAGRPYDEIIEDALSRYLLERLLDKTQRRANLSEEEATRLALEELHAMRRERGAAA
jgi:hypothetical protein